MKTSDGSVHDTNQVYAWDEAKDLFLQELNAARFGGFDDWRIPSEKEIQTILATSRPEPPLIDPDFFPNTAADQYWSWYICGSGEFINTRTNFGTERKPGKKFLITIELQPTLGDVAAWAEFLRRHRQSEG
jgi:hypothetical protein